MALYLPPSLDFVLERLPFSTWVDHVPFAYDLVEALRPNRLVELGTQAGVSYFTFCQSVLDHGLRTSCFAIDTWKGDDHTSGYGEDVYEDVRTYNESKYAGFSTLLRMRFEAAVDRFEDDSIDLLHIDGYHTYEAVKRDFETWYPKVAPGGIVLFHDVMARLLDFGAWKYWQELAVSHQTFVFKHGFGLGVLRKPGNTTPDACLLRMLFSEDEQTPAMLRRFYVHASEHHDLKRKHARLLKLRAQSRDGS